MRSKAIFLLVALVLLSSLAGAGCSSGQKGTAVDFMKQLPRNYVSFIFIDIARMRADDELKEMYSGIQDSMLSGFEEIPGLNIAAVKSVALARTGEEDSTVVIFYGDFNLEELRQKLQEYKLVADTYQKTEVWNLAEENLSLALVNKNSIVISAETGLKRSLDVIKGGAASLYDSADFRDIAQRLPPGLMTVLDTQSLIVDQPEINAPKLTGVTLTKKDKATITVSGVMKFGDAGAAQTALEPIKADLKTEESFRGISVTQDTVFVEFTADADISEIGF